MRVFVRLRRATRRGNDGSAQEMLRQAMAQGFGVVDKIDFDELTFETEDE